MSISAPPPLPMPPWTVLSTPPTKSNLRESLSMGLVLSEGIVMRGIKARAQGYALITAEHTNKDTHPV